MTKFGVQKPYWKARAAAKAYCTGCKTLVPDRPSPVVTARPWAWMAGYRQLCTGRPSTCTVKAPQSPLSHPFFTPKQPRSRTYVRKHCLLVRLRRPPHR